MLRPSWLSIDVYALKNLHFMLSLIHVCVSFLPSKVMRDKSRIFKALEKPSSPKFQKVAVKINTLVCEKSALE